MTSELPPVEAERCDCNRPSYVSAPSEHSTQSFARRQPPSLLAGNQLVYRVTEHILCRTGKSD